MRAGSGRGIEFEEGREGELRVWSGREGAGCGIGVDEVGYGSFVDKAEGCRTPIHSYVANARWPDSYSMTAMFVIEVTPHICIGVNSWDGQYIDYYLLLLPPLVFCIAFHYLFIYL